MKDARIAFDIRSMGAEVQLTISVNDPPVTHVVRFSPRESFAFANAMVAAVNAANEWQRARAKMRAVGAELVQRALAGEDKA